MTWTASLMPDDALPPDSFVGRMLNPLKDETGSGDVIFVAEPEPLPLWRVMLTAYDAAPSRPRMGCAAEIEALRDWLLPVEPEPVMPPFAKWSERQRLRALLTEQARIARGD